MRILCDQNVPAKYVTALEQTDEVTVTTVAEALRHDASDADVSEFAAREGWVVFTNDDDFFVTGDDHGLLLYDQLEDPSPGDVVTATERIAAAYHSHATVVETVPGEWL